jgi:hypothetical protein
MEPKAQQAPRTEIKKQGVKRQQTPATDNNKEKKSEER